MPVSRSIFVALVVLTFLRLMVAGASEPTPAEASLWLAGQRMAAGFHESGPLVPLMVKVSGWVLGPGALGVRWFAPWIGLALSLVTWRLVASQFGEKSAGWAVLLLNISPWFNEQCLRIGPAGVALTCQVAACAAVWRALHRAVGWSPWWAIAGCFWGLGLLASLTALWWLAGLVALIGFSRRWRGLWRRPGPWLAALAGLILALPYFVWLAQAEWLPVRWAGWSERPLAWWWRAARGAGQLIALASPVLLVGMIWAVGSAVPALWKSRIVDRDRVDGLRFWLAFALAGLAGVLTGPIGSGELRLAFFAGLIVLVTRWSEVDLAPFAVRLAQNAGLLLAGLYSLVLADTDIVRDRGVVWPHDFDPTSEARGWTLTAAQLASVVEKVRTPTAGAAPAAWEIRTLSPEWAAALSIAWPGTDRHHSTLVRPLEVPVPTSNFSYWAEPAGADPPPGVLCAVEAGAAAEAVPETLSRTFSSVQFVTAFDVVRGGHALRRVAVFACSRYRPPAP